MAKVKLTDAVVANAVLPDGKADLTLWDMEVTGFGLRLRPAGKTWVIGYRPARTGRAGQFKTMRFGTPETIKTAREARAQARVFLGQIVNGIDPLAEKAKLRARKRTTVSEMLERYESNLRRRHYVNVRTTMSTLRRNMAGMLNRDVTTINGPELAELIATLEEAGKAGAAQDLRSVARAFFGWCVAKEHVLATSPLAGYRKERATRADKIAIEEYGRALSDEELAKVWRAASEDKAFGRLIRFYVLTGCRRGEGAGLTWAMINPEEKFMDLPAIFVKQGRGHRVYLSASLAQVLHRCTIDSRSEYVFAAWRTGGKMSGWTKMTTKLRIRAGVQFHLHDLRRTFRTGLSRLGVDPDTAELAVGHAREDLERIYNRDPAVAKLRAAFEAWAQHVQRIADAYP